MSFASSIEIIGVGWPLLRVAALSYVPVRQIYLYGCLSRGRDLTNADARCTLLAVCARDPLFERSPYSLFCLPIDGQTMTSGFVKPPSRGSRFLKNIRPCDPLFFAFFSRDASLIFAVHLFNCVPRIFLDSYNVSESNSNRRVCYQR